MAAESKKPMNLDKLAKMIAAGFENTATKQDIGDVKGDIAKIDERLAIVEAKLDKALYTSITGLEVRVKRLEQKIGIR